MKKNRLFEVFEYVTGVKINEDLTYAHVDDASPEQDQSQIGTEVSEGRGIYNFDNKPGQSKNNFLQNEWSKKYRRQFGSYREYLAAMESKAVLNPETQTYQWSM